MNATKDSNLAIELHFILNVVDEWPPVAIEGVPCIQVEGGYRIETPPLFVKGLSVGDVISAEFNLDGTSRHGNSFLVQVGLRCGSCEPGRATTSSQFFRVCNQ